MISRRKVMAAGLGTGLGAGLVSASVATGSALAQEGNGIEPLLVDTDREPDALIPLWPDGPPGGIPEGLATVMEERVEGEALRDRAYKTITDPHLAVFKAAEPDGSALMIMPGGGYTYVVIDKEGYEGARWFSRKGMTVFVLFYRLPGEGWAAGPDTPLQDAQRAMRLIRSRAEEFGIDPGKVAALGYSAGGHLSASLATRFDAPVYEPADGADSLPARPDLSATAYPVITMTEFTHSWSQFRLLGEDPAPELIAAYSPEQNMRADTPPLFIFHSTDDDGVPVENALAFYEGARAAGVPADLHVFPTGGHGYGFRVPLSETASDWPLLFDRWRRRHFLG